MDWMTIITNLLPLVPAPSGAGQVTVLAHLALELINRIKSQTGMTTEQIFERAGLTLEQNKLKLLADLERLNAGGGGTGGGGGGGTN
jgi:hypothetical protein